MSPRPPLPPFTEETARQKVQAAEDAWNTRDPERVAGAYTENSVWRNRHEFVTGRAEIVEFLRRKWSRELDYALRKELWSFHGNRIAVRFQYESRNEAGHIDLRRGRGLTDGRYTPQRSSRPFDAQEVPPRRPRHGPV